MPGDDIQIEPIRGLPEVPPEGEQILWQGAPGGWTLSRDALNLGWVAAYFGALAVWRGTAIGAEFGWRLGIKATGPYLVMGAIACAILLVIGFTLAKTTVYTITNRRVAMRIGAALTVTLNIPFTRLASADLSLNRDGSGTIALRLADTTKLSYLVCWPHVRPWRMRVTQPALRSIPDAERIAALLAGAAEARMGRGPVSVQRRVPAILAAE